jgi:hypothetical protein
VADARNSGYTCYRGRARSMLESSSLRLMVVRLKRVLGRGGLYSLEEVRLCSRGEDVAGSRAMMI